ncbi:MAG: non-hydrolyzing UDP-N-acetylglucosamine 2-epimerase [Bacillota bacterium]|nr:UDP-N-acetylglucosamine 2-epimerase (non-hydrolyzing) [Candidatus Fermentithermobacillaceae bacterium]
MKSIKVLSVFGTRPEAIKMAPVVIQLACRSPEFTSKVAATAQHREMLDQVIAHFGISKHYDLDIMQEDQSLADVTSRVLTRLTPVLRQERPDIVLVHGDTTTTAASALAAYYEKIPCGHVEAGLRTGDKYAPFPEEINRKLAGIVSDIHFAPTIGAKHNLLREGIPEESVFVTGNTAIDALLMTVKDDYTFTDKTLASLFGSGDICYNSECSSDGRSDTKTIVVEVHRRENFGVGMANICRALASVARQRAGDVRLLVSVHRNPNAREPVLKHLSGIDNVILFDPLPYPDYVNLISRAYLVVSDSGGIQEEAPAVGVPVVLCREKTERPEAIQAGTVVLAGTDRNLIMDTIHDLLDNKERCERMSTAKNPFGDGRAAQRIAEALLYWFGLSSQRPEEFGTYR